MTASVSKTERKAKYDRRKNLPPGPGPGRPKGTKNKLQTDVKNMILTALNKAGGADYLEKQAHENPVAFMTLVGKVLPKQVTGMDGKDLIPREVRFVMVEPKPEKPAIEGKAKRV